jgi:cytochrome c biogenesis protein CcmG, thiol:disulfide interchange protein DsbE
MGVEEIKRMRKQWLSAFIRRFSSVSSQRNLAPLMIRSLIRPIIRWAWKRHNFRYYRPVKRTAFLVGLLMVLAGCYSGGKPSRIGSNAPDFTVQDSDHKVSLGQFRGQVVVLNFWGSFCPPCIEETPSLVRMQNRLKAKGVVVLAVSIDSDDAAYHKFLKDYNINLVTVRDGDQKSSALYGTFGWPETYIIDRQGVIRRKFIGAVDWGSPEITDYLSRL